MRNNTQPSSSSRKHLIRFGLIPLILMARFATAAIDHPPPEVIDLNAQQKFQQIVGLPADKKSVKSFSHAEHATTYLTGRSAYAAKPYPADFTCQACHQAFTEQEALLNSAPEARLAAALDANGGASNLKNYFHAICLECHKSMKKAAITSGPTACNGCHNR